MQKTRLAQHDLTKIQEDQQEKSHQPEPAEQPPHIKTIPAEDPDPCPAIRGTKEGYQHLRSSGPEAEYWHPR